MSTHDDDQDSVADLLGLSDEDSDASSGSLLSLVEAGDGDADDDADDGDGLELDDQQSDEIQRIFSTTLPQYLEPVEEMLAQILGGNTEAETIDALQGTLSSLGSAASRMGFDEVGVLLGNLGADVEHLQTCQAEGAATDELEEQIQGHLAAVRAFARQLGGEDGERAAGVSTSIFKALRDLEGVDETVLSRLSAAGLMTVDQLRMGRPDEIAVVSGLDLETVHHILEQLGPAADTPAEAPAVADAAELPATPKVAGQTAPSSDGTSAPIDGIVAAEDRSSGAVVELPLDAEPLEASLRRRLGAQVDAEAALEEARAEVRALHQQVQQRREQLRELEQACDQRRKRLVACSVELSDGVSQLERARTARERALRATREADEALDEQTERAERMRAEQRALSDAEAACAEQVADAVRRIGRVRRLASSG